MQDEIHIKVAVLEEKVANFDEKMDERFKTVNEKLDNQFAVLNDHIKYHQRTDEKSSNRRWDLILIAINVFVTGVLSYKVYFGTPSIATNANAATLIMK